MTKNTSYKMRVEHRTNHLVYLGFIHTPITDRLLFYIYFSYLQIQKTNNNKTNLDQSRFIVTTPVQQCFIMSTCIFIDSERGLNNLFNNGCMFHFEKSFKQKQFGRAYFIKKNAVAVYTFSSRQNQYFYYLFCFQQFLYNVCSIIH